MACGKPTKYFAATKSKSSRKKSRRSNKTVKQSSPFNSATSLDKPLEEAYPKKRVRFAEKLDNDGSLDSGMRERIEHNLKYNDDTIFDNMTIFTQGDPLNDSTIQSRPKKVREKEKYPAAALLQNKDYEEEEDEEEKGDHSKNGI